ncbi:MAG: hypothetical protein GX957_14435 [Clostridiaceae bacterium]|nr:hypothetical protein [Clostridiaceae bacterium]
MEHKRGNFIKILKSTTLVFAVILVVASIYGMEKGLSLLVLCFGAKEIINAKEYYDKQQKKMAMVSLIVGIFVCVCGFLALTNMI